MEYREAEILRLYYGVGKQSTLTLEEIALKFDLTRALDRLRHPSRMPRLEKFRD